MTEIERLRIRLKTHRGEQLTPEEKAMLEADPMPNAYREEVKADEAEHWEPSIQKAADWIGVDRADLSKHIRKHKVEKKSKLGFECVALKASYRAEHPEKDAPRTTGNSKERKEAAQAGLMELRLQREKGLVIPVQDVRSFILKSGNKLNDEWKRFTDDFRAVGASMPPEQFDEWAYGRVEEINAEIRRWLAAFITEEENRKNNEEERKQEQ